MTEPRREVVANKKVKWGVLSTAAIGVKKVIPGMQLGEWCEIAAIASRDGQKAEAVLVLRGIACRSGDRGHLQPVAESFACAVVDQSGGSGEARAVREADWN